MHKNRSQGFTLIELLVVIAIIGILSAVVLASLNTARTKGQDAAIQSDLSTIQVQAEIYYGSTAGGNTYGTAGTACSGAGTGGVFLETTIAKAITALEIANGAGTATCGNSTTAYAISSPLATSGTTYWCVDSTGFAGQRATAGVTVGNTCPAS